MSILKTFSSYFSPKNGNSPGIYSALVSRAKLAAKLGYQYGGDRDIYEALGYKTDLTYADYVTQFERQDIARAIITRPVHTTWRGGFEVIETSDADETPLEKEWKTVDKEFSLSTVMERADILTGLGLYGVIVLGFDDAQTIFDLQNPVRPGKRRLIYAKPLGEWSAKVLTYDDDVNSPRYGKPLMYSVMFENPVNLKSEVPSISVHYSRIIHIVDGNIESEVEGTPRLQAVFNRLKDLEKIVGASAEMFWRGARPGYQGKVDPEFNMTADTRSGLEDEIDEYEHNLRRFLVTEGVDISPLASQVADPAGHIDAQIQMISAETGIPKRILTGSERGELASSQDKDSWLAVIQNRREGFAESKILRPIIDKLIDVGVLPKPKDGEYTVEWSDLFAESEKDMAEVGRVRATALKEYSMSPFASEIVPPDAFFEFFLGLGQDQIDLIKEIKESEIEQESADFESEESSQDDEM